MTTENSKEVHPTFSRRSNIVRVAGVTACFAAFGAGIATNYMIHQTHYVTQVDQVRCDSGEPFVGAYIKTPDGANETWAQWERVDAAGSTARVTVSLPENTSYHLNVGCGGTEKSWGRKPATPEVVIRPEIENRFVCDASKLAAGNCVIFS